MTQKLRFKLILLITLFVIPSKANKKDYIEGYLKNGLHYIIKENNLPEKKVEYRLVYKLGSLVENKEERGMAHFLEHMVFKGTTHFPDRKAVEYLESIGMTYGFDINAYTGYDRTIYMFTTPTDSDTYIDNSLLILHDWLSELTLAPKNIEAEKGIIEAEINDFQEMDPFYDLKIGIGKHLDGIPIGTVEDIHKITPKGLTTFYKKWYIPENATLIVVGDINSKVVEQKIIHTFGNIPSSSNTAVPIYDLEYNKGISYKQYCDTLFSKSRLELISPTPYISSKSTSNIIKSEKKKILLEMINARLKESNLGGISESWYLAKTSHFCYDIQSDKNEELVRGVKYLIDILKQLHHYGCNIEELDGRSKAAAYNFSHRFDNGGINTSSSLCDELLNYVLVDDYTHLSDKAKKDIICKIKDFNIIELKELAGSLLEELRDISLLAYTNNGINQPLCKSKIKGIIADRSTDSININYQYQLKTASNLTVTSQIPKPSFLTTNHYSYNEKDIESKTHYPKLDVTDIYLTNGIRLIIKPTLGYDDNIYLNILSKGGLNHIPDSIYKNIDGMVGYIDMCGINGENNEQLTEYLLDKQIALATAQYPFYHGFTGMTKQNEISDILQLIKEKITRPEICTEDFNNIKMDLLETAGSTNIIKSMMERQSTYEKDLALDSIALGYFHRVGAETIDEIKQLDYQMMLEYYTKTFSNTDGLVIIISGRMDIDRTIEDAVKVLSSFPKVSLGNPILYGITPQIEKPIKIAYYTRNSKEPISFNFLYEGVYDGNLKASLTLKLMRQLLRSRLIKTLREEKGLVYSPGISLHLRNLPDPSFCFDISASTDTKSTAIITQSIIDIINELQTKKVEEKELNAIKQTFLINKRESLNKYDSMAWRDALSTLIKEEHKISDFEEYDDIIYSITPDMVRSAFKNNIDASKYILLHTGIFNIQ